MKALLQFLHRNPWIYIVLAFVILIGVWTTAYILAGRVPTHEIPLTAPATPGH